MKRNFSAETRRSLLLGFIVLTLTAAVIILPSQFGSAANTWEKSRRQHFSKTRKFGGRIGRLRHSPSQKR